MAANISHARVPVFWRIVEEGMSLLRGVCRRFWLRQLQAVYKDALHAFCTDAYAA